MLSHLGGDEKHHYRLHLQSCTEYNEAVVWVTAVFMLCSFNVFIIFVSTTEEVEFAFL